MVNRSARWRPRRRTTRVEWPTLALAALVYGSFFLLTWNHAAIPPWLLLPMGAFVVALHGSLQHEIIHGHPTSFRRFNDLLALPPLWLWLPYRVYRESHLVHHNNDRLTDPLDDPESYYVNRRHWDDLSRPMRALLVANQTLLGRLTLGVGLAVYGMWRNEWRRFEAGDRGRILFWAEHAFYVGLLYAYVVHVAGMPIWQYVLFFALPGTSLSLIRSFDEHRPAENIGGRCTIVEAGAFFRLLFLNNNYHALHHLHPGVAWYRLPDLYRAKRDEVLNWNEGFLRQGYKEVFRRYFVRPRDHPSHPYH